MIAHFASYATFFLTLALADGIACLGLNLQWGWTGLFNAGVAGFYAIGAYATALLTAPAQPGLLGGGGLPFWVGWLGAAVLSAAVALAIGRPVLRLRADFLAIVTFGFAVSVQLVALNATALTGGAFGRSFLPHPFASAPATLALVAGLALLAWVGLERLVASPWGRALRAVREDEGAAAALGKNPAALRLQSFVLGAALIGLAGAIRAQFIGFVAPEDFLPVLTFRIWVMLIVGGAGNFTGALAGAVVVSALWSGSGAALTALLPPAWQVRGAAVQVVAIGVGIALLLLFRPRGLVAERVRVSRHLPPPPPGSGPRRERGGDGDGRRHPRSGG